MISLRPKKEFRFPITAECINPSVFERKTCNGIADLKVWEGNKQKKLGELFKIEDIRMENESEKTSVVLHGDLGKVRRIGAGMECGEITIHGNVGMHLGEEMKDGRIIVDGDVGGWAGSMMRGGAIEIRGDAADYLGAPYRGSSEGMRGGKITVYGNVGNEAGAYMKKGLIKIYGSAGQFTGLRMHNGTIYVQNDCGGRTGACMVGGTIVIGGVLESVLPTFTIEGIRKRAKIEEGEVVEAPFYLFLGDLAEDGKGKLYVVREKNPNLSYYERFI